MIFTFCFLRTQLISTSSPESLLLCFLAFPKPKSPRNLKHQSLIYSNPGCSSTCMFETMDGEKSRNTGLGEVSFSSYLSTTAEEVFVHKSPEGEIGVFGAEKYFDTKLDDDGDRLRQMGPRRWPGTPSASSEASWSSQSVLLRSSMRDRSVNKQKRVDGRSFLFNLSCSGSCSDGKSVYVNQNFDRGRVHAKEVTRNSVSKLETQLDDPRKSLEVFGTAATKKGDVTKNLERKLSMLTWDAIPNAPIVSSISRSSRADDDVESDCSSDLFEINNIYGDGPYAPSETSIEWSVVTAGAADCSLVSDYDEKKPKTVTRVSNAVKETQKTRSGGILGCRSHKAVKIAETAYTRDRKMKSSNIINN